MKTFNTEEYSQAVLDEPEAVPVVAEVVEEPVELEPVPEKPCPEKRRRRHGMAWWVSVALCGLVACLWPLSYAAPRCYNWWPKDLLRASFGNEPGLGSVVGNSAGYVYVLRGRMAARVPEPGRGIETRWDLEDWWGTPQFGVGTRRWSFVISDTCFAQQGVVLPVWALSVPALGVLAVLWSSRQGAAGRYSAGGMRRLRTVA
jgi:hypothetical protein